MRLALAALAFFVSTAQAQEAPSRLDPCLAAVQSRYVHETERQLGRAFAVASESEVALSFDEADALFGRRTDVRDAHDRYANQEVSHLLARIERFESIQPLTSNNRRALVAGFDRRSRGRGIVVLETEQGARAFEFANADRRRALDHAQAALETCPPD